MDTTFNILAREIAEQRVRARRAEERIREVWHMLADLGLTLWRTDGDLRLKSSYGMVIAESFVDRPIWDFYREAYGIDDPDSEPVAGHRDARLGEKVTLTFEHDDRQFAMLIEPERDENGVVVGTVGMAVDLSAEDD